MNQEKCRCVDYIPGSGIFCFIRIRVSKGQISDSYPYI